MSTLARLFEEAQDLHEAGRLADAKARYERVLAADPHHGPAMHMLGLMAYQIGQHDVAVDLMKQAAKRDPGSAALHSNLGLALRAAGRTAEAVASFRRSLALAPHHAEAHNNLGNALLEQGQVDAALGAYARAVALNPELAAAHANLGDALWVSGRLADGEASYLRALALEPGNPDIFKSLTQVATARGDATTALRRSQQMLALEDSPRAHRIFADIIQSLIWDHGEDDPALRQLLTRAIAEAWGRPSVLANVAGKLIKSRLAAGGRLEDDGLLRVLLPAAPNSDVALERILTKARHDILVRALAGESGDADFAAALAGQCYLNEYVFDLAADEAATVAALATRQAGGEQLSEPLLVALACYLPLGRLAHAERLTAKSAALAALLRQQRDEPAEEKRLAAAMPRLTPIEDQVSRQVQAQYEENPYPRWVRLQEPPPRTQVGAYLRSRFPYARLAQSSLLEKPDMLVAGCGTGQSTLELARQFTLGEVLAIDLSSASLAHGARKAAEAGMNDVRFAQADILRIGALGRQFGLIESGGVLHHMADPFAGWRALVDCMAPGGVMLAAFYSQAARRAIAKTRSWIAGEGFTATPEGIRACRRRLMQEEAEGKLFLKAGDFFSMSACRDLLFHVQEHNMTLAQIAGFIAANGLSFIGFEVAERVMANYRERFPDDPGAVNFANWSQIEAENPGTFAAMYQFWVQKK